jgi:Tfp pilus assembly protein PilO
MNAFLKRGTWIITIGLAVLAIVYLKFLWLPGHRAIKELSEQVEADQTFVAQSAGLSVALAATQKELDQSRAMVEAWNKQAPMHRDLPGLYAKIDGLAKTVNLSIEQFDPQPFVSYQQIREIPVNLTCSGTFAHIYEFLQSIEGLPVSIWIESMQIDKTSQDRKHVKCELSLVIFSDNTQSSDYTRQDK